MAHICTQFNKQRTERKKKDVPKKEKNVYNTQLYNLNVGRWGFQKQIK